LKIYFNFFILIVFLGPSCICTGLYFWTPFSPV
jgi:hypothetical protein